MLKSCFAVCCLDEEEQRIPNVTNSSPPNGLKSALRKAGSIRIVPAQGTAEAVTQIVEPPVSEPQTARTSESNAVTTVEAGDVVDEAGWTQDEGFPGLRPCTVTFVEDVETVKVSQPQLVPDESAQFSSREELLKKKVSWRDIIQRNDQKYLEDDLVPESVRSEKVSPSLIVDEIKSS